MARAANASRTVTSLLATGLVAASALLTGCSGVNPIITDKPYRPSDGVRLQLDGHVSAANLMIVAPTPGGPGVLLGALTNDSGFPTTVTITNKVRVKGLKPPAAGGSFTLTVPLAVGETALLGTQDGIQTRVPMTNARPGGLLGLGVSTTGPDKESDKEKVAVPVLDGRLPEYATVTPAPATGAGDAQPKRPEM